MTLDKILIGATAFLEQEIAAPAPSSWQKFAYYAMIPMAVKILQQKAEEYKPLAESLGIVSADGDWDLSMLKEATEEAIRKSGPFTAAGVIIKADDLTKLWDVYLQE